MLALYKAALITAFAPTGRQAFRVTCFRLGGLALLALAMGYILSRGISHLLLNNPGGGSLFPSALFIMQLSVLCVLFAAAGLSRRLYHNTFARWLAVMPVSLRQRWIALNLPRFTLAMLAAVLVCWPLAAFFLPLGLQPLLFVIALMGGTVSALGLSRSLPARLAVLQCLLLPLLLWSEYKLLGVMYSYGATTNNKCIAALTFAAIISICIVFFVRSSRYALHDITHLQSVKKVTLSFLPATWPVKKLLRSPSFRLSFIAAFMLNSIAVYIGKKYGLDGSTLSLCISLTIAACVADIRGLTPRQAPAEITSLRGSIHFGWCGLAAASLVSALLSLPLFLLAGGVLPANFPLVLVGLAAGLFAGALLTPQSRDISSQFLSTLLCLGIIIALPALPLLPAHTAGQPTFQLTCASLLVIASGYIEYRRNRFTWRTLSCLKRKDRRS